MGHLTYGLRRRLGIGGCVATVALAAAVGHAAAAAAPVWQVLGTTPISGEPRQMVLSPDGSKVYVANNSGQVDVLDGTTGAVIDTIPVASGSRPTGMGIDPAGTTLYVGTYPAGPLLDGITTVDIATKAVTSSVATANGWAWDIDVSPSGAKVFGAGYAVGFFAAHSFAVLSQPGGLLTNVQLPAGSGADHRVPGSGALTPDGSRYYITACSPDDPTTCSTPGIVHVYDANTNTLDTTISSGVSGEPEGIAADPVRPRMYVRSKRDNRIDIIDTTSNTVVGYIAGIGASSTRSFISLAISPSGQYMVTANRGDNTVQILDLTTDTVERTITVADGLPAGNGAFSAVINDATGRLFIGNRDGNSVTVLNAPAPPGTPTAVSPSASETSATVACSAPASDGGSAITRYEYSLDGGITWVAGGASCPLSIAGLKAGTPYSVSLRAVNAIGPGPMSGGVAFTTKPGQAATPTGSAQTPAEKAAESAPTIAMSSASVLKGATLTTTVNPSVAGTVRVVATLAGRGVCTATKKATKAGRMTVTCTLSPRARAVIARKPTTRLKVTATLTDAAGKKATASRVVIVPRYRVVTPVTG